MTPMQADLASDARARVTLAAAGIALYASLLFVSDVRPGQRYLGSVGANAALPLLLVLAPPALNWLRRPPPGVAQPTVFVRSFCRGVVALALYLGLDTAVLLALHGNEAGLFTAARYAGTIGLCLISVLVGAWACATRPRAVLVATYVALAVQIILLLVEKGRPDWILFAQGPFHLGPNIQQRPRILSTESSTAGITLLATAACIAWLERSPSRAAVCLAGTLALSFLVQSRGTDAVVGVAAGLALLAQRGFARAGRRGGMAATAVAGVIALFALAQPWILRSSLVGQDAYSSNATRYTYSVAMYRAARTDPFGAGFAAPVTSERQWIAGSEQDAAHHFSASQLSEVDSLLRQTGNTNLAPKTLTGTFTFLGGIIGFMFVILFFRCLALAGQSQLSLTHSGLLRVVRLVGALTIAVALVVYVSGIYTYEVTLFAGILLQSGRGFDAADSRV